jgi:hypothetical protein
MLVHRLQGRACSRSGDWLVLFEHPREKVPELPALGLFPAPNNSSAMGIEKTKPRGEELSELENSLFSKLKLTGYLAIPRFKMPTMPV